jgi:DNA-binding MarR family transcriptional regulator
MSRRAKSAAAAATRGLGDADYQALGEFRRAMREFLAFSEAGAREHGLTSQQHQALLAVRSHFGAEAITVGELAASLLIKNHSAVELVGRLAEKGLLERSTSARDRRRVLVSLTLAGRAALEEISLRNLGRLKRASEHLAGILATTLRLDAQGIWGADDGAPED